MADFKKNDNYSSRVIEKHIRVHKLAKETNNKELMKIATENIYGFLYKFIWKILWSSYPTLMRNPYHKEELVQEVWLKILEEIDNYDSQKASITTFLKPWIKHVVSDYCSKNFRKTTPYYSSAMSKVSAAINYYESKGEAPALDKIVQMTCLPETTVLEALDQLIRKDTVSYDALAEVGYEQQSHIRGPEEQMLRNDRTARVNRYIMELLTPFELEVVQCLLSPEATSKEKASYREIAEKLDSNIPFIKQTVSHITAKLKNQELLFLEHSSLLMRMEEYMTDANAPLLDDKDLIDEQISDLREFLDEPTSQKKGDDPADPEDNGSKGGPKTK